MKFLQLLLVCFGSVFTIYAQTSSDNSGIRMTSGADRLHAQLQLTTSVIKQQYCADGGLRFTLRLNFTNLGKETIILDKRSSIISQYIVSRNLKAAAEKKYEIREHRLIGLSSAGMSFAPALDESFFIVLKLGESYSLNQVFSLNGYDSNRHRNSLGMGNHVLKITVLTWYYPKASNVEWREKWRQKGYLWSDSVASIPMLFTVEEKPSVEDCRK